MSHRKGLKVAVLLSGGVDSSVALRLLHAAGHSCIAFYLKIWFQEDFENFWTECPWEEDMKYAKAVYDQVKDQTYFLSHLSQAQLRRLIFHLEEVRKLATKFDLPNKDKKDSQGICFLGKRRSVSFSVSLTIEHCEDGGEDIAVVQLSEDDQGLAAGQFAAFYQGRRCLGSGVILEAWDDQGFPLCKKALEIARMEDKSKLGKPVKIKVKPETPMEFDNNKGIESSRNLFNGQNGVVENRNTTSQVQEEAIPRFPGNWMHKLSEKWTHCVAGIKFAFEKMPIFDI